MVKNYFFYIFLIFTLFIALPSEAQNKETISSAIENIPGLTIYPNPVNSQNTYVHIISKLNAPKQVQIFDVLGKRLMSKNLVGRELNISQLSKGIYILKITEKGQSETRKLVIK
ncbi:T9SS type A sorting domain-containing protein [Tamlana sp. s12]|uniref:T9SS type A sorting domain-containing protein n=1 Tax=Tamlana sp. s12 TaxID=1630406 RepID=UPI000802325D|nr:T9SS type A sorting domain-containing protein [Tamlana sp. s12]OBQ57294.1 hypothetical protein VQ01_02125 [Tamlana sp. s12]QQY82515.1 T9SS type A sorting domain-containing protein [Tamlana sp. s12]